MNSLVWKHVGRGRGLRVDGPVVVGERFAGHHVVDVGSRGEAAVLRGCHDEVLPLVDQGIQFVLAIGLSGGSSPLVLINLLAVLVQILRVRHEALSIKKSLRHYLIFTIYCLDRRATVEHIERNGSQTGSMLA